MNVILLTGSEVRHHYFRGFISSNLNVVKTICESDRLSLANRTSCLDEEIRNYVHDRTLSEKDLFYHKFSKELGSPILIEKGMINDDAIQEDIIELNPDLIICFGSSLIKGSLVSHFEGRMINLHLGLSPYYRGSGTNFFALSDGHPEYVGATFMFLDEGIDTGNIIHQVQARYFSGDSVHDIGHRLILDAIHLIPDLVDLFPDFGSYDPINTDGKLVLRRDFNLNTLRRLKYRFENGLIDDYLNNPIKIPLIQQASLL